MIDTHLTEFHEQGTLCVFFVSCKIPCSQLCRLEPPSQLLHGLLMARPRRPCVLVVLFDKEGKGGGGARRLGFKASSRRGARRRRLVVDDEGEGAAADAATLRGK